MLLIKICRSQFKDKRSWSFQKFSRRCGKISRKKDIKDKNRGKKVNDSCLLPDKYSINK